MNQPTRNLLTKTLPENNPKNNLRIVSLIPSATEIVVSLGYGPYLVGRSHECDFPADLCAKLPVCTEPKFDPSGTSRQIHERVTDLLTHALSVYRVKVDLLAALNPTHIITQAQCEVCAVSLSDVENAVMTLGKSNATSPEQLPKTPITIVSLQPERLADVWTDMARVAAALEKHQPADSPTRATIETLKSRLRPAQTITPRPNAARPNVVCPNVVCIEWTDPLMAAGNWVPELVSLAGGKTIFGKAGEHSDWMTWEALTNANPDIIIVMPCGYSMSQTRQATETMAAHPQWANLSAVQNNQVYLTDGNQYFNRPGPRLVESYDILTEIIQGHAIDNTRQPVGWEKF